MAGSVLSATRMLLSAFCLGISLLLASGNESLVDAEHVPQMTWMKEFTGQDGRSCCGEFDCVDATVALLDETATTRTVMIGEHVLTIPRTWAHPAKYATGVWCFVPSLMSSTFYIDMDGIQRATPPAVPTIDNTRCVFFVSLQ